jgi:hypothetical protein
MKEIGDTSLMALVLYVTVCGISIEAAYQKVKLLTHRRRQDDAEPEPPLAEEAENLYGPPLPTERIAANTRHKKADPIDELVPLAIGVLVVWAFWPTSVFSFMPFHPRWPWLDVAMTSLILSRGANFSHETYRDFGKLAEGLIGRVWRFF